MRRTLSIALLCLIVGAVFAQITDISPTRPAPLILPQVSPEMRTAGYWIARHPNPDSLVMDRAAINTFNSGIRRKYGTVTAIEEHSISISGTTIRNQITSIHNMYKNRRLYDATGARVARERWAELERLENRTAIPRNISVRFALAGAYTDQRLAPTMDNFNSSPGDIYFDELQNSAYDIGTPFVLYHSSSDGKWAFGATSRTSGWVLLENMVIVPRSVWREFQQASDKLVMISAKSDVWADSLATRHQGMVRMGVAFPYAGESGAYYRLRLPIPSAEGGSLGWGYVLKQDVHRGYLPYTPRNALLQAFKMNNHSYGWGDMNGDWDCSSMLFSIFSSFGVMLPRNGATQAQAGRVVQEFIERNDSAMRTSAISRKAIAGITMLQMRGHIMLYIGEVNGVPYVIHNTSGYRTPAEEADKNYVYRIMKTVVSDLELGEGSVRGSLLKRLLKISIVG